MSLSALRYGKQEVVDPTQIPKEVEKSTFFSPSIPEDVKKMVPLLHTLPIETVTKIIEKENDINDDSDELIISFADSIDVEVDFLGIVLSGLRSVKRYVLKNKIVLGVVYADLAKMNVPKVHIDIFISKLRGVRRSCEVQLYEKRLGFPTVSKLRWRVDVVISTGSLSKVMRPSITFQVFPSPLSLYPLFPLFSKVFST